jgi:polysaccharide pyruvyl transferase WcaK-like protein
MKILHIGVFDRNIGDSIALDNLQRSFTKYVPNVTFHNQNIENFWAFKNNIKMCCEYFDQVCPNFDAIVVGGGGLLEYAGYKDHETKYKLPFNEEIFRHITIPVYFYGLGVNVFRGGVEYSEVAKNSLQETINNSAAFTVRNDGSFTKLNDWIKVNTSKVEVVPDPGLLHLDRFGVEDKNTVSIGAVQPAFNASAGINKHRFNGNDNIEFLKKLFKDFVYYPHTGKDFDKLGNQPIISQNKFNSTYKLTKHLDDFLVKYKLIDYVVAMRGHGQMITIGMNIPGIYLSTQDKVRDFSIENGFEDYNVDILEDDWRNKLQEKITKLTEPGSSYLKQWYDIRHSFVDQCHKIDHQFFKTYFNAV